MGHSRKSKQESHERVVQAAAARFREAGIEGIGVADLMQAAGLTHGGFYKHFSSREDLVAQAVDRALRDGGKFVDAIHRALDKTTGSPPRAAAARRRWLLDAIVDDYLSETHRDTLATACAVSALAGDVSRSNKKAKAAYARQVQRYLDLLIRLIAGGKRSPARTKAISALATLVGAVSMSRAVGDPKLSLEILRSAAQDLKAQLK